MVQKCQSGRFKSISNSQCTLTLIAPIVCIVITSKVCKNFPRESANTFAPEVCYFVLKVYTIRTFKAKVCKNFEGNNYRGFQYEILGELTLTPIAPSPFSEPGSLNPPSKCTDPNPSFTLTLHLISPHSVTNIQHQHRCKLSFQTVQVSYFRPFSFFLLGPSTFSLLHRPLSVFWTVHFDPRPSTFSRFVL